MRRAGVRDKAVDGELQVAHEREQTPAAALSLPALFALCAPCLVLPKACSQDLFFIHASALQMLLQPL